MTNLFKWFGGFFEDQNGNTSRKGLVLYIFCFIFWLEVKANIQGVTIDPQILYITAAIILFCVGAITAEFFKGNDLKIDKTEITKSESKVTKETV